MASRLLTAQAVVTPGGAIGDAVLVEGDRVAAIGKAADLRRPGVEEVPHAGGYILPGLVDAHIHPLDLTATRHGMSLQDASSLEEVTERLATAAGRLAFHQALLASHLDEERLAEGRLPTRWDLDRAVADRPVLVFRRCGHIAVANSAALLAAGVGPATPDPPGGAYDRHSEGEPNGVLRETAVDRVAAALEPLAPGPTAQQLHATLVGLAERGLARLHAIVSAADGESCARDDDLATLAEVAPVSPLQLEVLVIASHPDTLRRAAELLASAGGRVRFRGWKAFADGSLGGHTAALHQPYADRPGTRGVLRLDPDWAREMATTALELGGEVAIHAIGDLAADRVLDLYQELAEGGSDPQRLRIEHASLLTDAAVERMAALGAVASVQPAFLPSDSPWLEKRLGAHRLPLAYRFGDLAAAGVPLLAGSDAPVEEPDPWWGMAAARTGEPHQRLTPAQALAAFTRPLRVGDPADLVVADRNPLQEEPDGVAGTRVIASFVGGRPVADDPV